MPARRYRPGYDALSFRVSGNGRPELFDHADRFVPYSEALLDRILTLEDVHIGPADGGGRDSDECIRRANIRYRLLTENDSTRLDEYGCFHVSDEIFLR